MAYVGELVRMANGRWARFQSCEPRGSGAPLLVAVELDERYQKMLDAAEPSLEGYRKQGIHVRVRLDADESGDVSVQFASTSATL